MHNKKAKRADPCLRFGFFSPTLPWEAGKMLRCSTSSRRGDLAASQCLCIFYSASQGLYINTSGFISFRKTHTQSNRGAGKNIGSQQLRDLWQHTHVPACTHGTREKEKRKLKPSAACGSSKNHHILRRKGASLPTANCSAIHVENR